MITLKSERELGKIRTACRVVAETLALVRPLATPGVTTADLDKQAEKRIIDSRAEPAFKGHGASGKRPPFPASICTSVNEEVVHGVPGERVLRDGDLLSVDCGARYKGYYDDGAVTIPVGTVPELALRLIQVCRDALELAIQAIGPGKPVSAIGRTVQAHVEANGFSVVRDLVGHGIGASLWEEPQVPNFYKPRAADVALRPGMVIAVETMITAGQWRVTTLANRWTVASRDGSLAAHFEHSLAITSDGVEILTVVPDHKG